MELFRLFGKIVVDNSEANEEIDESTKKASESSSKMSDSFKKIGAAVATYLTLDAIKTFGAGILTAAADASAASSQFAQVFGEFESQASNSLSKLAAEGGISENRLKGSFTQIAAFAKTSGMDTESSLSLSERAMRAVADSAAFYDRSIEDTTESLQSFLKGNYENDAALGLSATETTRNAAANKLYGKSFNDLSESQKQLTLLQMVEDANKLSGAMGQAARESDTWSNVTGNLKQTWTDFQAVLGAYVLPKAVGVVKSLAEHVTKLAEKIPDVVAWFDKYKGVLAGVATAIGIVKAAIIAQTAVQAIQAAMNAAEVTSLGALIALKIQSANASVMVIENAERFGLSQLHQLRGRVGRGASQSHCVLVTDYKLSEDTRKRMEIMTSSNDGFEIAEADLKLRGPGDMEGTQQSGIAFDLKIANLARDEQLLQYVREVARKVIDIDPNHDNPDYRVVWERLRTIKNMKNWNWGAIS